METKFGGEDAFEDISQGPDGQMRKGAEELKFEQGPKKNDIVVGRTSDKTIDVEDARKALIAKYPEIAREFGIGEYDEEVEGRGRFDEIKGPSDEGVGDMSKAEVVLAVQNVLSNMGDRNFPNFVPSRDSSSKLVPVISKMISGYLSAKNKKLKDEDGLRGNGSEGETPEPKVRINLRPLTEGQEFKTEHTKQFFSVNANGQRYQVEVAIDGRWL